jgi:hypothetical protein
MDDLLNNKKILNLIDKKIKNDTYELEVRLLGDIFNNKLNNIGLNGLTFKKILEYLTFSKENNGLGLKYEKSFNLDINFLDNYKLIINNLDEIKKFWLNNDISSINYELYKKILVDNIIIEDYSLKISLSNEVKIDNIDPDFEITNKLFRYKIRHSIYSEDNLFRFDFSEVKTVNDIDIKSSNLFKKHFNYEIEIEYIGNSKNKNEIEKSLIKNIELILMLHQDSIILIKQNEYNSVIKYYQKLVNTNKFIAPNPITLQLKNLIDSKKYINILTKYAITYKADGERFFLLINTLGDIYLINNNFVLKKLDLNNKKYKDSLFECELIDNDIYIYDLLYKNNKDIRNTPLIGLNSRSHNIDDFLKNNLKSKYFNIKKKEHHSSSNIFEKINELLNNKDKLGYLTDGLIFTPINEYYLNNGGTWNYLFKWKPENLNSIDFLIEIEKSEDGKYLKVPQFINDEVYQMVKIKLKVSGYRENYNNNRSKREKMCQPIYFNPFNQGVQIAYVQIIDDKIFLEDKSDIIEDDTIVEFTYDKYEKNELLRWKPIRIRYDKTFKYKNNETVFGNFEKVANDIWKSINYPVTEYIIRNGKVDENINKIEIECQEEYYSNENGNTNPNKRLAYQKFHTYYIKRNLIKKVFSNINSSNNKLQGSLFDIGYGKLGDLPSWIHNKISYIFGIDVNSDNYEQSLQIYEEMPTPKPNIVLAHGDFSKLIFPDYDIAMNDDSREIIKKSLISKYQFDVVSCQFALSYFYRDEVTIMTFLQNVSDNLKIGGHFIGTVFDGEKVIELLGKQKTIEGSVNNKTIWKINKNYRNGNFDYDKPLFGKKINVFISSIGKEFEENLVNFNYLKILAAKYNLEIVEEKNFSELYDEMKESSNKNYKNIELSDDEKQFSFLNVQFIFKKTAHPPTNLLLQLQKKLKKIKD